MSLIINKQLVLKPQDLLVVLKIAVNPGRNFTYAELACELFMSASEVHSAVRRAQVCSLMQRTEELTPIKFALQEFLSHGIRYVFPLINGPLTRGFATATDGPVLSEHFSRSDSLPQVWPHADGDTQGLTLQPIYASVPSACKIDMKLYEVMTLVDALRGGSARSKELAVSLLPQYLR